MKNFYAAKLFPPPPNRKDISYEKTSMARKTEHAHPTP